MLSSCRPSFNNYSCFISCMTSFFNLPKYLFIPFCLEWLSLKHIAKLDTANCNKNTRGVFLQNLGASSFIVPGINEKAGTLAFIRWLTLRGIAVLKLELACVVSHIDLVESRSYLQYFSTLLGMPHDDSLPKYISKLRYLEIKRCYEMNVDVVYAFLKHASQLQELRLTSSNDVNDHVLTKIGIMSPRLEILDFSGCPSITDHGIVKLSNYCRNLKQLTADCISDEAVSALAHHCPHLTSLHLYGSINLTDAGIIKLSKGCTMLEELSIRHNNSLTDTAMCALAVNSRHLRHLNLSLSRAVTDVGITQLVDSCLELKVLQLYYVGNVSQECVQYIMRQCGARLSLLKVDGCRLIYHP